MIFTDLTQADLDNRDSISEKIDIDYLKSFLNSVLNAFSSSEIVNVYLDFLYGDEQELELNCIQEIFFDCFVYTIDLACESRKKETIDDNVMNDNKPLVEYKMSANCKQTLDGLVNSIINSNNTYQASGDINEANEKIKISKDKFKNWILNEFSELFYGYHNWLITKIKNRKGFNVEVRDSLGYY